MQECEALGLEAPHFATLDDVAADIGATAASWARYGDFLKERDELAHKDWLSMRDQVSAGANKDSIDFFIKALP
jgi:dynein heavy chain 2